MRRSIVVGCGCGFLVVLGLAGCRPAQLRMPPGFSATATAWEVSGHSPRRYDAPVQFGPYRTEALADGGSFAWRIPVGALDLGASTRHYAFTLVAEQRPPLEVRCEVAAAAVGHGRVRGSVETRVELDVTGLSGPAFGCGLRVADPAAPIGLLALSRDGVRLDGSLDSPWGRARVRSLHEFEGTVMPSYAPNGFEVLLDGRTMMVVDVLNAGRVSFGPGLDAGQRDYFAAVAAALLLLGEDAEA